jgi:hypothetical protein
MLPDGRQLAWLIRNGRKAEVEYMIMQNITHISHNTLVTMLKSFPELNPSVIFGPKNPKHYIKFVPDEPKKINDRVTFQLIYYNLREMVILSHIWLTGNYYYNQKYNKFHKLARRNGLRKQIDEAFGKAVTLWNLSRPDIGNFKSQYVYTTGDQPRAVVYKENIKRPEYIFSLGGAISQIVSYAQYNEKESIDIPKPGLGTIIDDVDVIPPILEDFVKYIESTSLPTSIKFAFSSLNCPRILSRREWAVAKREWWLANERKWWLSAERERWLSMPK